MIRLSSRKPGAPVLLLALLLVLALVLVLGAAPAWGFVPAPPSGSSTTARPRHHRPLAAAPPLGGGSSNGDFDPDPLMEGGGDGSPPPPASDMLARIFQGAQARRASSGEGGDWARYTGSLRGGVVLVANPEAFLKGGLDPQLARRFFLPTDLSLEMVGGLGRNAVDNLANVLPVVLLLGSGAGGTTGLVLNRRTGYLVGDLNVDSSGFKVQPVHLGGMAEGEGLFMLHTYPDVPNAQQVTMDGLHFGGNYTAAQELVREGKASSSRFKFFIQQTYWAPGQLRAEVEDMKVWFPASVSKDVLLKNRGREGPKMVKPLWTEVMEMMGGSFRQMRDELYKDTDEPDPDADGSGGSSSSSGSGSGSDAKGGGPSPSSSLLG